MGQGYRSVIMGIMTLSLIMLGLGCHKCTECTIEDNAGEVVTNYGEKCGTRKQLEDFQNACDRGAGINGSGLSCECTEIK